MWLLQLQTESVWKNNFLHWELVYCTPIIQNITFCNHHNNLTIDKRYYINLHMFVFDNRIFRLCRCLGLPYPFTVDYALTKLHVLGIILMGQLSKRTHVEKQTALLQDKPFDTIVTIEN